jgi:putative ABC transport system permease protein
MEWTKRFFRRQRQQQEFDLELQHHIEALTSENLAQGMTFEEARRRALADFGGRAQFRDAMDEVHRLPLIESLTSNLRFALRMMRKAPGLAAAVIFTLALGIGANTAVFSALDAILLRPLPFPQGDRLMLLRQGNRKQQAASPFVAPVRLEDWSRMTTTFQSLTGYYTEDASETSGALPEKVTLAYVAPRFLQVWGIAPALGHDFTPEEEKHGDSDLALISDRLWRSKFNADPNVIGKKLHFATYALTIVGVMPASFLFPVRNVDIWSWIPTDSPYAQSRDAIWYTVVGRLKPGITLEQARSDMAVVQSRLGAQFPKTDADLVVELVPLKDTIIGSSRGSLWVLFAGVTLLLLIACSNIAGLLLARATHREQEISVRFALGARRGTVMAQLLTEVFLLALLGSLAGLALSVFAARAFRLMAHDLPRVDEIAVNWRIVLYSLGCALVTAFLCGIFPALRSTRGQPGAALALGSRTQVSARSRLQWWLAGVQVALAVTLLAGAGLLLRTFQQLGRVSPGFDPSHVLTLHITGSYGETVDMKALTQRINRTLDALRATPGVEAAASSATLPGISRRRESELVVPEGDVDPGRKVVADMRFVSSGYFSTLRVPVLAGDSCRDSAGPTGIVVNRSFAEAYFGQKPVIGHHLRSDAIPSFPMTGEIRGVAADAREQGINEAPMPTVYWCVSAPDPDPHYLIRTKAGPLGMADSIRRVIHGIEPGRSVFDVVSLDSQLSNSFAENRMRTLLLTLFALTAISMACVGLYATLSYLVAVRQREVGLRLALGAQRWQIAGRFLTQGLVVCLIGCACGLAFQLAAGRLLRGMLYGVSPHDTVTMLAVVGLVVLVTGSAVLFPALRAARTDPMHALREG